MNIHKKPIIQGYNKFLFRQEEGTKATNAIRGDNLESRIRLKTRTRYPISIEEDDSSDHSTLQNLKKKVTKRNKISPTKIPRDKLMITFGDKTNTTTNTRKQVAQKTLAQKAPEPRGTLKPLWNSIQVVQ